MTATLREIEARDLSRRVQIDASDSELTGLVASINQLLDRLQRSFGNLRQFAGDVSHQLQTPLTVIKSTIEAQLRRPDAAPHQTALAELGHQIDGLSATVTGLQALALADAPIPAGTFSLSESVAEGTDIIVTLAEMKGVTLVRQIAADIHASGDPVRVRQIVLNLGENAIKFTPSGGSVQIDLKRDGDEAVLTVGDTGPGINRQDQSRVFERLFRGDGSAGRQGIGIGLAIVKGIVDAHGGTIEVGSRPERGTTFTVRLPISMPD
jgi:signal transduction histidine kinase